MVRGPGWTAKAPVLQAGARVDFRAGALGNTCCLPGASLAPDRIDVDVDLSDA